MKPSFKQLEFFERWLPIAGYEGLYEVSDWGRVRSIGSTNRPGRLFKSPVGKAGYPLVGLSKNKHKISKNVHRLVAEAFLGVCPAGKEVDHIDGDKTNATLENLRYVTPRQNTVAAHKRIGRIAKKVSHQQIQEMRRLQLEGMSQRRIAKSFGITQPAVSYVLTKHFIRKEG